MDSSASDTDRDSAPKMYNVAIKHPTIKLTCLDSVSHKTKMLYIIRRDTNTLLHEYLHKDVITELKQLDKLNCPMSRNIISEIERIDVNILLKYGLRNKDDVIMDKLRMHSRYYWKPNLKTSDVLEFLETTDLSKIVHTGYCNQGTGLNCLFTDLSNPTIRKYFKMLNENNIIIIPDYKCLISHDDIEILNYTMNIDIRSRDKLINLVPFILKEKKTSSFLAIFNHPKFQDMTPYLINQMVMYGNIELIKVILSKIDVLSPNIFGELISRFGKLAFDFLFSHPGFKLDSYSVETIAEIYSENSYEIVNCMNDFIKHNSSLSDIISGLLSNRKLAVDCFAKIQWMINEGIFDANYCPGSSNTSNIMYICKHYRGAPFETEAIINLVLENPKIEINASHMNCSNFTLLMFAYQYTNPSIIEKILALPNTDVNAVSHQNITALSLALKHSSFTPIMWLLNHPDIKITSREIDAAESHFDKFFIKKLVSMV